MVIIKDNDWEKLEQTEENAITLITCIENQPEYRRCGSGSNCLFYNRYAFCLLCTVRIGFLNPVIPLTESVYSVFERE